MPRTRSRSSTIARLDLAVRLVDERARASRVVVELLGARPSSIAERDEPLLRAVVQVALDPAPVGDGDVDRAGARLLEGLDALLELRAARSSSIRIPRSTQARPRTIQGVRNSAATPATRTSVMLRALGSSESPSPNATLLNCQPVSETKSSESDTDQATTATTNVAMPTIGWTTPR